MVLWKYSCFLGPVKGSFACNPCNTPTKEPTSFISHRPRIRGTSLKEHVVLITKLKDQWWIPSPWYEILCEISTEENASDHSKKIQWSMVARHASCHCNLNCPWLYLSISVYTRCKLPMHSTSSHKYGDDTSFSCVIYTYSNEFWGLYVICGVSTPKDPISCDN